MEEGAEMSRKRKQPKMSPHAKATISLGTDLLTQILGTGSVPTVVIGSKALGVSGALDYTVASPLKKDEIIYVLKRVTGLLEGTIPLRPSTEVN